MVVMTRIWSASKIILMGYVFYSQNDRKLQLSPILCLQPAALIVESEKAQNEAVKTAWVKVETG
jgi:hypothetical protein